MAIWRARIGKLAKVQILHHADRYCRARRLRLWVYRLLLSRLRARRQRHRARRIEHFKENAILARSFAVSQCVANGRGVSIHRTASYVKLR